MDYFILEDGVEIPKVGMGTYLIKNQQLPNFLEMLMISDIENLIRNGDIKMSELLQILFKKIGIRREDIFITPKVNQSGMFLFGYYGTNDFIHRASNIRYHSEIKAILASFENLGLEYVDLFLVHAACPWYLEMYEELTNLYK